MERTKAKAGLGYDAMLNRIRERRVNDVVTAILPHLVHTPARARAVEQADALDQKKTVPPMADTVKHSLN